MWITIPQNKQRNRVASVFTVHVLGQSSLPPVQLSGRIAWALMELHQAGARGCTPIDYPGPRWSDYVFKLRALGFDIETVRENHGGRFPGSHGRYVLRSQVLIKRGSAEKEAA